MHRCIKATVGALVVSENRILLARRNHEPFYNHWCIPGGHIEYGELVEDAMKRELREETGLIAHSYRFFGYYTEYYPELEWHAVALIFVVRPRLLEPGTPEQADSGEPGQPDSKEQGTLTGVLRRQEEEVKELSLFSPEETAELPMAFEHGRIISDYLSSDRSQARN
ncbi:MAG: NUDIX hydrolase [Spirochaetia bacterium]